MGPRIEGRATIRQFTHRAEQKIILGRPMRGAGSIGPGSRTIIMALGTQIDIGAQSIFVGKGGDRRHIGAGEVKNIGGRNRAAQLHRAAISRVRVVTYGAGNGEIVIMGDGGRRILRINQRKPGGTRMTNAASVEVGGGCSHGPQSVRGNGCMVAANPLLKGRWIGIGGVTGMVTTATHRGGNFHARTHRGIVRRSGVTGGRTVAVFALDPTQQRGGCRAHKAGCQAVPDCVAGQTGGIGLPARRHKFSAAESAGVRRIGLIAANSEMAGNTNLGASIFRSRTGNAEKSITVKAGDGGSAGQIGGPAQSNPRCL